MRIEPAQKRKKESDISRNNHEFNSQISVQKQPQCRIKGSFTSNTEATQCVTYHKEDKKKKKYIYIQEPQAE